MSAFILFASSKFCIKKQNLQKLNFLLIPVHLNRPIGDPYLYNKTDDSDSTWLTAFAECPLLNIDSDMDKVRLVTEMIQLIAAFLYIVAALREMKFLGLHMFIENLVWNALGQNLKWKNQIDYFRQFSEKFNFKRLILKIVSMILLNFR